MPKRNDIKSILIIGAGQIGSRHLQGALKSSHKTLITLVILFVCSPVRSRIKTYKAFLLYCSIFSLFSNIWRIESATCMSDWFEKIKFSLFARSIN